MSYYARSAPLGSSSMTAAALSGPSSYLPGFGSCMSPVRAPSYAGLGGGYRQAAAGLGIASAQVSTGALCGGGSSGKVLQQSLNQLGYGPIAVDGQVGSGTITAMKRFCAAYGVPPAAWPNAQICGAIKAALAEQEQQVAAAAAQAQQAQLVETQGGGQAQPPIDATPVVQVAPPTDAGMSTDTMLAVGAGVVVAVGLVAFLVTRKSSMRRNPDLGAWPYESPGSCCSCAL